MNKKQFVILRELAEQDRSKLSHYNQRALAEKLSFSLGLVNKCIAGLRDGEFITDSLALTAKAKNFLETAKPQNAIILAAGYGLRMVPINQNKPKALLTVDGKPLIERQIEQLQETGVKDITIVVGYMKEAFDYLTDKYGVKLVYNKYYSEKNNLFSMYCVSSRICDTYIIPCDIYCARNPFSKHEHFTWYMINELIDDHSPVRVTRNGKLDYNINQKGGNTMVGISFISKEDAPKLQERIKALCQDENNNNEFWETALFEKSGIDVEANVTKSSETVEINSYEQLRELDCYSTELQNESISVICDVFDCKNEDIQNINTLKKGMTNRSYIFEVKNKRYIMRIPGEGTDQLINRKEEAEVYETIKGKGICDELFYINPENGMKISAFIENSRCCDAYNEDDLKKCMKKLRAFHEMKLKTKHEFNIYEKIDFYESLWTEKSIFMDYEQTKKNALSLKGFIDSCKPEFSLTHIDAVPDNFLFSESDGKENVQLIDWEYSGMQDPHVDIAMFCIYSLYKEKKDIDRLIDIYFEGKYTEQNRIKIYCYVALCGLLWSNWCEYKRQLGVEFGEYSLMQYRYAKDYYKLAREEMKKLRNNKSEIKRAIIMAAGLGNRMRPVTDKTPKPLIEVNGKRMIDTIVDALHENGIYEIYVVVGYKKEQFYKWAEGKDGITVIDNDLYDTCNNISSLYSAREHIEEAIILDGDQMIYNPEILTPNFTKSGYSCAWTDDETDEWLLSINEDNKVVSCSRTGGKNGWQLFSISRWTKEDGAKLKAFVEEEFEKNKNRQIYWDDVAMFCYPHSFDLTVYPITKGDIVEIDNFSELCKIDDSYKNYK